MAAATLVQDGTAEFRQVQRGIAIAVSMDTSAGLVPETPHFLEAMEARSCMPDAGKAWYLFSAELWKWIDSSRALSSLHSWRM